MEGRHRARVRGVPHPHALRRRGRTEPSPRLGLDPTTSINSELLALKIQDLIDSLPGYFGPDDLAALHEVQQTRCPTA